MIPGNILVVDDESAVADTICEILTFSGFQAEAVYGSRQALQRLRSASFSVLLSDVVMPGMDGIELAAQVRQEFPTTRVLLMSGNYHVRSQFGAANTPSPECEVLRKPFPASFVVTRIERELQEAERVNRARARAVA